MTITVPVLSLNDGEQLINGKGYTSQDAALNDFENVANSLFSEAVNKVCIIDFLTIELA